MRSAPTLLAIVAALGVLVARHRDADAKFHLGFHGGGHGGGHGGHGGHGGGGGGGAMHHSMRVSILHAIPDIIVDDEDDDPCPDSPKVCDPPDESPLIHGYGASYGQWSRAGRYPDMSFETGLVVEHFTSPLGDAALPRGTSAARLPASARLDTSLMVVLRSTVALTHGFYGGGELDYGGLIAGNETLTLGDGLVLPSTASVGDLLGVVGWRARIARVSLGLELAGGVRSLDYDFAQGADDIPVDVSTSVLQARVRADVWVTPLISIGATAGQSLLDRDEWMTGLELSFHTHPFANTH